MLGTAESFRLYKLSDSASVRDVSLKSLVRIQTSESKLLEADFTRISSHAKQDPSESTTDRELYILPIVWVNKGTSSGAQSASTYPNPPMAESRHRDPLSESSYGE